MYVEKFVLILCGFILILLVHKFERWQRREIESQCEYLQKVQNNYEIFKTKIFDMLCVLKGFEKLSIYEKFRFEKKFKENDLICINEIDNLFKEKTITIARLLKFKTNMFALYCQYNQDWDLRSKAFDSFCGDFEIEVVKLFDKYFATKQSEMTMTINSLKEEYSLKNNAIKEDYELKTKALKEKIQSLYDKINEMKLLIETIKTERCKDKIYRGVEEILNKEFQYLDDVIYDMQNKIRKAPDSAMKVKSAKNDAKFYERRYLRMRCEYDTLFELFPELENYLERYEEKNINETLSDVVNEYDYVKKWVTKEEYKKLNENERNQLALDRYIESRKKTKWQIGRDYEMFCGWKFKEKGYEVEYFGIENGLEDKGRDLIAQKDNEILVIQCKNWAKGKIIHEKHICQLFGTALKYKIENNSRSLSLFEKKITPLFITTTILSDTAKEFAQNLGVEYMENYSFKEYPRIKCNINNGEKIYHLPFDQQYDRTQIKKKGEYFAWTVNEASSNGFRRAKKWIPD